MLFPFLKYYCYWTALLLNAFPTSYSKLLSWNTSTRNCQQASLTFFYYPFGQWKYHKNLSHKAWLSEGLSEGLLKKPSKKAIHWLFSRDSVIFKTTPAPRISSALFFYPSKKKFCFTNTIIPKLETPFNWLVFDILFHAWSTLEFNHMLLNVLRIIIWNSINKTLELCKLWERCKLYQFWQIFCCPKNGGFIKYLPISI